MIAPIGFDETDDEYTARLEAHIAKLVAVLDWVDSWVSNPVGSYSVAALDGLFAMTRDRIAALQQSTEKP